MADTVLTLMQRIARKLGLNPDISIVSDQDETAWLLDRMNERYTELRRLLPKPINYFDTTTSINFSVGQRLANLPSTLHLPELYSFSVMDVSISTQKRPLAFTSLPQLLENHPDYTTCMGTQLQYYFEGKQLGVYPVPVVAATVSLMFAATPARLTTLSDTFVLPDDWLLYIELGVELDYQLWRGQGQPEMTLKRLMDQFALIYTERFQMTKERFKS